MAVSKKQIEAVFPARWFLRAIAIVLSALDQRLARGMGGFCFGRRTGGNVYNKLFTKILDSSIWMESDGTRLVWLTMLAAMDQDGFCPFASVANLAHRARVTLQAATHAVNVLEKPDRNSADPDNDGRRIERTQGGWIVLNARKYGVMVTAEQIRETNRERQRRFRERKRAESAPCNAPVTPANVTVTQSDTDTNTDIGTPESTMPSLAPNPEPDAPKQPESPDVAAAFEAYRSAIQPKARLLPSARDKIKRRLDTYTLDELLQAVANFAADAWYMANNAHRGAAWFFHSDDRIEQYINLVPRAQDTDTRKDEHGSNGRYKREPAEGHRFSALTGFSRRLD